MGVFTVAVAVATLWSSPGAARPLTPAAQLRLTTAQRLALVGRIETQALHGERVVVLARRGAWARVVVPDQPTSRDRRGYPGWVRADALTAEPVGPPAHLVTASTRSFGALLPGPGRLLPRTAADVVRTARRFLGIRYLWGGTSPWGFDCSGLAWSVYRARGITIPRDSQDQARAGRAARTPRAGDLVFYGARFTHVAIAAGGGRMIESPQSSSSLREVPLRPGWTAARRYLPRA